MAVAPIIVLVNPQMGENIGAAARAMSNFDVTELRIVQPRDGWPNPAAESLAAHGLSVVKAAKVFDTLQEAVADCELVMATSARIRIMNKPLVTLRQWVESPQVGRTAILFGRERWGLENEEVALANKLITIPVSAVNPSLNLAQSVGVVCYEWYQHQEENRLVAQEEVLATREEYFGLFEHLETALDKAGYWQTDKKKPRMWQNLRNSLLKAQLQSQEVKTLRGMVKALQKLGDET